MTTMTTDPPWLPDEERKPDAEILIELSEHRASPGGAILDVPEMVESVWGEGHRCLWARGEPFIVCGPDGVGKTSLAQQLTLRLAGVLTGPLLGFPVHQHGRVLYLACDRPTQALRSFRRMVTEDDVELLNRNLTIWRGPPPVDMVREPKGLLLLARHFGAETVVIDSLKDIANDLSKEESGLALSAAFQNCVAEGVEVAALHHQRKQQTGAGKPRHLSDVYGSRWITAGAGSVAMLWGEAGDLVVDFDHLKQPDEQVGPLKVVHDHVNGISTAAETVDAWTVVRDARNGISAVGAAIIMFGSPIPERNETEKARRQLERLAKEGRVHKQEGTRGGPGGGDAAMYYPLTVVDGGRK